MYNSLNTAHIISASADGSVWATTNTRQIYRYDIGANQWQKMSGELVDIAVGSASNIWGVSADGKVWKYDSDSNIWQPMSGILTQIAAAGDGEVWGVSSDTSVWRYDIGTNQWQLMPGRLMNIAVGSASNIWGVSIDGKVWKYDSGSRIWQPMSGILTQITAAGDGEVWGVSSDTTVWRYADDETLWQRMGQGFKQIAVGSASNAWGIDPNDVAICLTSSETNIDDGDEQWFPTQQKRWDSKNKYDQFQSTHLWIVSRAAEVARTEPTYGQSIFDLVQPGADVGQNAFHDGLCEGLWDADEADPYRNSVFEGDKWYNTLSATYKSHFYDPTTGMNWLGETDPTALTEGPKFFYEALKQYKNGNLRSAGYNLGLSLHYLTDMTQPMHSANFTVLSSNPPGYHTAFEALAIQLMKDVTINKPYSPSVWGNIPGNYIRAAAITSRPRAYKVCSLNNALAWQYPMYNYFYPWKEDVEPEIRGALADGVAITAQYLIAWMQAAQPSKPASDPHLFTQIYSGIHSGYWAIDSDSHLFHRAQWEDGWTSVVLPDNSPVISLWIDDQNNVFAVTPYAIWTLSLEKTWSQVYPPTLSDNETVILNIQQIAVVDPIQIWALDSTGIAYQGRGMMPDVQWTDTSSPKLTCLSAAFADSAWGANAEDQSVWEYMAGQWQNRGTGIIQVSVDSNGTPWGISADGYLVTYDGSTWQKPRVFYSYLKRPDWGALAWVNTRGALLIVDHRGIAWGPSPLIVYGESPWMPLG